MCFPHNALGSVQLSWVCNVRYKSYSGRDLRDAYGSVVGSDLYEDEIS